jgi:serine/threonine-protein kinase
LLSVIPTLAPPCWQRQRGQVKLVIITAILVILATSCGQHPAPSQTQTAQPAPPSATPPSGQIVLPFTGLNYPEGVAVDAAGNLYVADKQNDRVVKLPAG